MVVTTSLRAAGATDTGRQRDHNEDRLHVDPDRGVFMVIDGVGGHAAGETAADIALRMLRARLERETGSIPDRIREALTIANNAIHRAAAEQPALEGMSCVATVAMVASDRAVVGHVGDSRLYKLRGGEIRKVTSDHGPVGEREDRGELSEAQAMRHPRRNEIYRDLGSQPHTPTDEDFIELVEIPFEPDSALILCSDGLTDLVPSAELLDAACAHADDPPRVASRLIDAANRAGGKDNITVIFVAGERFAESRTRHAHASPRGARRAVRLIAAVFNRWTMLILGAIAGVLGTLAWMWAYPPPPPPSPPVVAAARTLVVGSTRDADYATIGAAVAAAARSDTIEVEPGEYAEQVRVPDHVTLVSRVRHEARLVPPPGAARWVAITIEAAGADGGGRVSGFAIAGGGGRPLAIGVLARSANVDLDALDVSGADDAAIAIAGASTAILRASRIHDNPGAGITVRDGATPQILHNYIVGNGLAPGRARAGLDVDASSGALLRWNVITGNGAGNVAGLAAADLGTARGENVIGPAAAPAAGRGARGTGGRP